MKWLNLLKNNAGKMVKDARTALVISAGVGIVGAIVMQNMVEP